MKNLNYFFSSITLALLLSCNQSQKNKAEAIITSNPVQKCYIAKFEKDSASLSLNATSNGKVTGQLYIKYHEIKPLVIERELTVGKIVGEFKGDTLFADYTFTSGTVNKTLYTNPMAFLRRGDTLTTGLGVINNYMGKSYFDKKRPLDFKNSRFHFIPVNCK